VYPLPLVMLTCSRSNPTQSAHEREIDRMRACACSPTSSSTSQRRILCPPAHDTSTPSTRLGVPYDTVNTSPSPGCVPRGGSCCRERRACRRADHSLPAPPQRREVRTPRADRRPDGDGGSEAAPHSALARSVPRPSVSPRRTASPVPRRAHPAPTRATERPPAGCPPLARGSTWRGRGARVAPSSPRRGGRLLRVWPPRRPPPWARRRRRRPTRGRR